MIGLFVQQMIKDQDPPTWSHAFVCGYLDAAIEHYLRGLSRVEHLTDQWMTVRAAKRAFDAYRVQGVSTREALERLAMWGPDAPVESDSPTGEVSTPQ